MCYEVVSNRGCIRAISLTTAIPAAERVSLGSWPRLFERSRLVVDALSQQLVSG